MQGLWGTLTTMMTPASSHNSWHIEHLGRRKRPETMSSESGSGRDQSTLGETHSATTMGRRNCSTGRRYQSRTESSGCQPLEEMKRGRGEGEDGTGKKRWVAHFMEVHHTNYIFFRALVFTQEIQAASPCRPSQGD